ncbi:hypothetical protein LC605_24425 [Nostoc sp. CHAB 5836]|nr:hypothetical protein [Nostoc sp. CHAB 5836]
MLTQLSQATFWEFEASSGRLKSAREDIGCMDSAQNVAQSDRKTKKSG